MIRQAMISDRNILDTFTADFTQIVEKYCEYIVVSGFVAISSGRSRGTEDIDIIIERISKEIFEQIHKELTSNDFECLQSKNIDEIYNSYLLHNLSVRYIQNGNLIPDMELKFAKDELDDYQLKTKIKLPETGLDIWFSNINVNVAFKEHLLKSPKDLEDAKHLRIVYEELINEDEITKVQDLIKKCRL